MQSTGALVFIVVAGVILARGSVAAGCVFAFISLFPLVMAMQCAKVLRRMGTP